MPMAIIIMHTVYTYVTHSFTDVYSLKIVTIHKYGCLLLDHPCKFIHEIASQLLFEVKICQSSKSYILEIKMLYGT